MDVKTKTKNDIDFNLTGEHNNDVQKSLGTLEAKYKSPAHGLTLVEKWNTDNILKAELTLEDSLLKGLKIGLDSSYSPATGYVYVSLSVYRSSGDEFDQFCCCFIEEKNRVC